EIEVLLDPRRIVGMQVDPCVFLRAAIPDNMAAVSWSGYRLNCLRLTVLPLRLVALGRALVELGFARLADLGAQAVLPCLQACGLRTRRLRLRGPGTAGLDGQG